MNRTGLIIALSVAAVTGIVFGLYPQLDLAISGLFYDQAQDTFPLRHDPWFKGIRKASMWVIGPLIAPAAVATLLKLLRPRRPMLISARAAVFLITTIILVLFLVHAVLKDDWKRSRPNLVQEFGGDHSFGSWWDPRGTCERRCSFVSGETAAAFWTIAPATLAPPAWRPLAYGAALAFGTGIGIMRILFGGHFFTDVVFAGIFTFLTIWIAHGLIYRWRTTRMSDEAIERVIARFMLPFYGVLTAAFRLIGVGPRITGGGALTKDREARSPPGDQSLQHADRTMAPKPGS